MSGPLVTELQVHSIDLHVAHPNKVRAYAKALGRLAKTDRLYGEHLEPVSQAPQTEETLELRVLVRRRQQLVRMRTEEKNRLEHEQSESVLRHIAWLDAELRDIEQAYRRHLGEEEQLARQATLYQSV